jgi:hypothetical protein
LPGEILNLDPNRLQLGIIPGEARDHFDFPSAEIIQRATNRLIESEIPLGSSTGSDVRANRRVCFHGRCHGQQGPTSGEIGFILQDRIAKRSHFSGKSGLGRINRYDAGIRAKGPKIGLGLEELLTQAVCLSGKKLEGTQ